MRYETPVLQDIGQAAHVVLGYDVGHGDNTVGDMTLTPAFALGLDE